METMSYLFDPGSTASIAVFTNTRFTLSSKAGAELKARFGGVDWLRNQGTLPGGMLAVQHNVPGNLEGLFYVYYLVISGGSSTGLGGEAVRTTALAAMITHAVANGVTEIRMALEGANYSNNAFRTVLDAAFNESGVTQTVINASDLD